jgi:hypothetical protein
VKVSHGSPSPDCCTALPPSPCARTPSASSFQARRDLENAGKNIGIGAYEVAAFLSHQGVEKFLKAAWIVRRRARPPASHYLEELGAGSSSLTSSWRSWPA